MSTRFMLKLTIGLAIAGLLTPKLLWASEDTHQAPVSLEDATAVVKAFVGSNRANSVHFKDNFRRKKFPPFADCRRFLVDLPVLMDSANGPEPSSEKSDSSSMAKNCEKYYQAVVLVDELGRLIDYQVGYGEYPEATYRNKQRPSKSDLLPEARVREIANDALAKTRISSDGLRLKTVRLYEPQRDNRCYHYDLAWYKYSEIAGVGEVEMPFTVFMDVDALTGEVYSFLLKDYPLAISLVAPTVTKEQAIELAGKVKWIAELKNTTVMDIHFKVDPAPFPNFDVPREVTLWDEDNPRFYEEIGKKRQALVWRITFKGEYTYPYAVPGYTVKPKVEERIAYVDTTTGKARAGF